MLCPGDGLLDILQRQLELVGVKLFGGAPELQALVIGHKLGEVLVDRLKLIIACGKFSIARGKFGALAMGEPEGGAKRFYILWQVAQIHFHTDD